MQKLIPLNNSDLKVVIIITTKINSSVSIYQCAMRHALHIIVQWNPS